MIDNTNWNYVYKICDGEYETTNLMYTPSMNLNGDIMCMHWDHKSAYQTNHRIDEQLLDLFFEREVKYLKIFENFSWCPKIYEIDIASKKIFLEWNKLFNILVKTSVTHSK